MANPVSVQYTAQSAQAAKQAADTAHQTERPTKNVSVSTGAKAVITFKGESASLNQPKLTKLNVADTKAATSAPPSGNDSGNPGAQVVIAKSTMGRPLTGNDIRDDSRVMVKGMETTIGAAKAMGAIRHNAAGVLVYADGYGDNAAAASADTQDQPKAQQQDQQQQAQPGPIEKLDDASEVAMTELVNAAPKLGNMETQAVTRHLSEEGSLPPDLLKRVASSMGQDPSAVGQKLEQVRAAFEKQARDAIGHDAEAVFSWAREHDADGLRRAIDQQVKRGTTKGYQEVAQRYFERLDTINPDEIIQSEAGQKLQAQREKDGTVTIVHPLYGRVQWSVAVRKGWFKVGFKG